MKSNYMNYFKDGKLYQWDKDMNVFIISNTNIQEEFCLDQKGMEMFLKFANPEISVGKTLQVKSGKVKGDIKLSDTSLVIPTFEEKFRFNLAINELKTAVKYIATKDNRIVLTGVNLGRGYITATDGFSSYRTPIECKECDIIITKQFIDAINSEDAGIVEIGCNDQMVVAYQKEKVYFGKLIAGVHPSLDKVYSNPGSKKCTFNKNKILQLLKYSMDSKDLVVLSENRLQIKGSTELDAAIDLGIDCKLFFSINKLNLALNSISQDEIEINYENSKKPVFFNQNILILPVVHEEE